MKGSPKVKECKNRVETLGLGKEEFLGDLEGSFIGLLGGKRGRAKKSETVGVGRISRSLESWIRQLEGAIGSGGVGFFETGADSGIFKGRGNINTAMC